MQFMYRLIGLIVSVPGIPILYQSVEQCIHNVCFSNPTIFIIAVLFRETKLSAPTVKKNYYTWTILMLALFPAPPSSLLTLQPIKTLVT